MVIDCAAMTVVRADYKSVWQNLAHSPDAAQFYVAGHNDDEKFHLEAEDTLDTLRETVGLRPEDVALEIGCGVGRVGRVLAPFVREWIGCDVSTNMLAQAKRRLTGLTN